MANAMYDQFKELCEGRKSVRTFLPREVEPEIIEMIKEIARTSPYASGRKNWDIIVVQDKQVMAQMAEAVAAKIAAIRDNIRSDFGDNFVEYAKSFLIFQSAPALFVTTFRIAPSLSLLLESKDEAVRIWERDNSVKSISCVAMMIILAARSLNLGSCYMTGPLIAADELKKIIHSRPQHEIGAIIPIGYYQFQGEENGC